MSHLQTHCAQTMIIMEFWSLMVTLKDFVVIVLKWACVRQINSSGYIAGRHAVCVVSNSSFQCSKQIEKFNRENRIYFIKNINDLFSDHNECHQVKLPEWSSCSKECGGGTRSRSPGIFGEIISLPGCEDRRPRVEDCNTHSCSGYY